MLELIAKSRTQQDFEHCVDEKGDKKKQGYLVSNLRCVKNVKIILTEYVQKCVFANIWVC